MPLEKYRFSSTNLVIFHHLLSFRYACSDCLKKVKKIEEADQLRAQLQAQFSHVESLHQPIGMQQGTDLCFFNHNEPFLFNLLDRGPFGGVTGTLCFGIQMTLLMDFKARVASSSPALFGCWCVISNNCRFVQYIIFQLP